MKKYKLGELVNVKRGMSLSGEYYATEGNLIRLTLGNFQEEGGFKINTSKDDLYFTGPVREEFVLKEGDIITPLTEQVVGLLGATARIPESNKYIQSGDVALIKCISNEIDDGYCYYLVSSDLVRRQLSAAAQQTKIRHTSPEKIMDCEVFIPEVKDQRKIAKLLDSINKKIELNEKINDNLSHMVQDVFVQMFADKTIHANSCILDVASKISDGEHGTVQNTAGTPYYLLSCKNIKNGHLTIGSDERTISEDTFKKLRNRTKLSKGDVLITSVGSVGEAYLLNSEPSHIEFQRSVAMIKPNKKVVTSSYLFASLVFQQPRLVNAAHGAVQQCLFLSDIEQLPIYIPTKDEVDSFDSYVTPLLNTITENDDENISLSLLREWLLPMLMSGQATIAD